MKKIALKIAVILASLFIFAGISYSYWTDEVDISVNAGTGEIDLKINESSILYSNGSTLKMQSYKNVENIEIIKLNSDGVKVSITFMNTGTIPVHVDSIKFYNFDLIQGKKTDGKDVDVTAALYSKGNLVLYKLTDFKSIKNKKSYLSIKTSSTVRLEPGETAVLHLTLTYKDNDKDKDNNGKDKGNDKDKKNNVSFEFSLGIIYSRFNE